MRIKEALEKYDRELKLKIGCADGDSFWYVGTVGHALANMAELNDALQKNAIDACARIEAALEEHLRREPSLQKYTRQELSKFDPAPTVDGYQQMLKDYFRAAVSKNRTAQERRRYAYNMKNITSREVLSCEMCDPSVDEGTLRMVIEGRERGMLWTTEEAKIIPGFYFTYKDLCEEGES